MEGGREGKGDGREGRAVVVHLVVVMVVVHSDGYDGDIKWCPYCTF